MKNNNYETTSEENFIKNTRRRKAATPKKKTSSPLAKGFAIAGISIGSFLGIILAIVLGAVIYFFTKPLLLDNERGANNTYVDADGNVVERATSDDKNGSENGDATKKYYTFLATATDRAGSLTDVIMIAKLTYNENDPSVSILQIPRDTYVKISSSKLYLNDNGELSEENFSGPTAKTAIKINEAYYRGKNLAYDTISDLLAEIDGKSAAEITVICSDYKYKFLHPDISKLKKYASGDSTVKKEMEAAIRRDFGIFYLEQLIFYNFRIPIDYYAQVNINGFRGIVDAIGGVDLTVPRDMDYDDPYQDLHIHLKKGYQHLDGEKAEQFVRFRGYVGGDVDRLDAQKIFMDAFIDKLMAVGLTKIDPIMEQVNKNLYTSVTFDNLIVLSKFVMKMDLSTDVKMHTIPGAGQYVNGVSYYLVDKEASWQLINDEFNVYTNDILIEDMLIVDHGNVYVPASTPGSNLEYVPEDDTDEEDDSETSSETDESGESSEEGEDGETDDGDMTDESDKNDEDEVIDESSEDSDDDEADQADEGNTTDESGESNEDDVTDNSDETDEGDITDESGENTQDDTTDDNTAVEPDEVTKEPSQETDEPVSDPAEDTSENETTVPDETENETADNNDSSIENDDNYALLEQMTDAA